MSTVILPMTLTQDTVHQPQVGRKGEDKRMFILSCRVTQFTKSNPWHYSGIFQSFHFLWWWGGAGVFEVVAIELRARSSTEGYTSSSESIKLIFIWINCEISAGLVLSRLGWYFFFLLLLHHGQCAQILSLHLSTVSKRQAMLVPFHRRRDWTFWVVSNFA